jgi:hypothetical protein
MATWHDNLSAVNRLRNRCLALPAMARPCPCSRKVTGAIQTVSEPGSHRGRRDGRRPSVHVHASPGAGRAPTNLAHIWHLANLYYKN